MTSCGIDGGRWRDFEWSSGEVGSEGLEGLEGGADKSL